VARGVKNIGQHSLRILVSFKHN